MPSSTVATINARTARMKASESSRSPTDIINIMESTTIKAQLIIGSVTGALSGFLGKVAGKGWAMAIGIGLVAFRLAGHVTNRPSIPSCFCAIPNPEDMNIIERFVNETVLFFNSNLFLALGYIGGFIVAFQVAGPSDG
ncbi:unnamed protein product [Nezara viridula]|uniref:Uncharacterized protein n=1 Tax=Nezara viridula TaxID=85310 RepID=A0A9P0H9R7_NEZVI|nr:unnamed protein product [Nezara viridula]